MNVPAKTNEGPLEAWNCTPLVIDNFDDLNTQPADTRFRRWEYTLYNTDTDIQTAHFGAYQPGYAGAGCLRFEWRIGDTVDGMVSYPGALIRTQALGSIDVSNLERFTFAYQYQHDGGCEPAGTLSVTLGCSELNASIGVDLFLAPTGWTAVSVPLGELQEASYNAQGIKPADCLKVVDEIDFTNGNPLGDGDCLSGTFMVDEVVIQ
jgi:hypothetical protein